MKKLIFIAAAALVAMPAFAQYQPEPNRDRGRDRDRGRNNPTSCNCVELQRRLHGLDYVRDNSRRFRIRNFEHNNLERVIRSGRNLYNRAAYARNNGSAGALCAQGSMIVNMQWMRWQPTLARIGVDHNVRRCELE